MKRLLRGFQPVRVLIVEFPSFVRQAGTQYMNVRKKCTLLEDDLGRD